MSKNAKRPFIREVLSLIIIALCTSHFVNQVLIKNSAGDDIFHELTPEANPVAQYEQHSFTLIAKIAYAGFVFFGKSSEEAGNAFAQGFSSMLEKPQGANPLYAERVLVAQAIGLGEIKDTICQKLKDKNQKLSSCKDSPTQERPQFLKSPKYIDPWFESLHSEVLTGDKTSESAYQQAASTTVKTLGLVLGGSLILAISGYLFYRILSMAFSGELDFRFRPTPEIRVELLETFAIYNAGMLFLPQLLQNVLVIDSIHEMLLFNIVGITSLSVIYFWPRLNNKFATQAAFGLKPVSFKNFLNDAAAGPFCYFAFISGLFAVILAYSALLQAFEINPGAGSHPIMPILAKNKGQSTWMLAALVAVVVAPLVEELFFRGALYGWLRTRFGALASILVSSMIFAVVHPQGAMGLVPLTCIGMMLAFAREWRDSLVTPILAHACVNGVTLLLASSVL